MFPTLIRIGDFHLATYGVFVALGYFTGIWWLSSQRQKMQLTEKQFWHLIYMLFFGAVLGGKLLYWAVSWREITSGALHPIRDLRYGFVFYGGFLGAVLMGWVYRRWMPGPFLAMTDYFGVATPLGHAIGRLGCLAAGCCAGRPTLQPWGIRFTHPESLVDAKFLGVPLHPTQVYESLSNAFIAFLMYSLLKQVQRGKIVPGTVFLAFIGLYSIARLINEFFRGDARGDFFLALSVSQWIALGLILAAVWAMATRGVWAQIRSR